MNVSHRASLLRGVATAGGGLLLAGILLAAGLRTGAAEAADGISERNFAIFRNGSDIGTRQLRIVRNGDSMEVTNETRIAVKVAFVTVYKRHEQLTEVWQGGKLIRFASDVDNDGTKFAMKAERQGDGTLRVEAASGTYAAPPEALPATYWNEDIARTGKLIHIMRGNLQNVATARVGEESTTAGGQAVQAIHYRMTGDERADLWFDADHLVVRVIYDDDGNEIEFKLTSSPAPGR